MIQPGAAYELASHIHDSVWQHNTILSDEALLNSNMHTSVGHMTGTKQVVTHSTGDPRDPRYETLTRAKNGKFYFQVTEGPEYVGEMSLGRHIITPNSGEDMALRLLDSLTVREFISLALRPE